MIRRSMCILVVRAFSCRLPTPQQTGMLLHKKERATTARRHRPRHGGAQSRSNLCGAHYRIHRERNGARRLVQTIGPRVVQSALTAVSAIRPTKLRRSGLNRIIRASPCAHTISNGSSTSLPEDMDADVMGEIGNCPSKPSTRARSRMYFCSLYRSRGSWAFR